MSGVQEHLVTSHDGTRLRAVTRGAATAPAVLLLHGVGSSSRFLLEAFAAPLLAAGWQLVAADLRGHGGSSRVTDPAAHGHGHHVHDVVALAEHFRPAVVGGVSLGGQAAVGAAVAGLPCRAVLACLPAWSGRAVPGHGPHAAVAAEVGRVGVGGMLDRFRHDTAMVPWLREVLARDWSAHDPVSLAAALRALDGALAPTTSELAALPMPLALVGWPDDPGHPLDVARSWARTAPRSDLREITLEAMQVDRTILGQAAAASLRALGIAPGEPRPR